MVDDQLLILQVSQGNRGAFDTLYRKYWKQVYSAAYKRLQNADLAKDVTQDVFTQLWSQLALKGSTTEIANLPAFLHIVVRNNVLTLLEKEKKYVPVSELLLQLRGRTAEHSDAQLLFDELQSAFHTLLNSLPQQQQKIFRMRYMENLTSNEIADILQISPKTVRNQLGKALKKLRPTYTLLLYLSCI